MTDRPIVFSAPMVRALIEGRKSQTRRLAWRDKKHFEGFPVGTVTDIERVPTSWQRVRSGDRLWVREHWTFINMLEERGRYEACIGYDADGPELPNRPIIRITRADYERLWNRKRDNWTKRKNPSIHMPRWASRITLTVTEVRRQRLSDITDADALAEGIVEVQSELNGTPYRRYLVPGVEHRLKEFPELSRETAREMYAAFWDTLHGSGEWLKDPEVVAISFRAALGNIDQFGKLAK